MSEPVSIISILEKWCEHSQLGPPLDEEQDQLWEYLKTKMIIPKYTGGFAKLESDVADLREDLLRIRTRVVWNSLSHVSWKVEDGGLRRRDDKIRGVYKPSRPNPANILAHRFTAADAHAALRLFWTSKKQQLYEDIQDLPKQASEDQFLELVTGVSPQLLATMTSSKHLNLLYALRLSDMFLLIKFSLRQDYNQIEKPLRGLKKYGKVEWEKVSQTKWIQRIYGKVEWEQVTQFKWIQGNESLVGNYRRIRDELCRQGTQEGSEKPNEGGQNLECNETASQEKYDQLSTVFQWFVDAHIAGMPYLDEELRLMRSTNPLGSRSTTPGTISTVKHFHTMPPHGLSGSFKAFSAQQSPTPGLLSGAPHRPRLGGGPFVRAAAGSILAPTSLLRGFRLLSKRG
ncbi:MAG: hypothetical protein Q9211_000600 [Gyalolechia sp. 1 TL-2023]